VTPATHVARHAWRRVLTVAVPLHLRLVALQGGVDDDGAAQAHGLALAAEGHAEVVHEVRLEGDAVLGHQAHWGGDREAGSGRDRGLVPADR